VIPRQLRALADIGASKVDVQGPIFVSYRQSDGKVYAISVAGLLRASGLPVWHDQTDLPPGDTNRNIKLALKSGISGAVLLVTPEIEWSPTVRRVELPRILRLSKDARFVFGVGTIMRKADGKPDYKAADRLLKVRRGTLAGVVQHPIDEEAEIARLVRDLLEQRLRSIDLGADLRLVIHFQTRLPARSWSEVDKPLSVRVPGPEAGSLPSAEGLRLLQSGLANLAAAVPLTSAKVVRIEGGAHLSVALAIGMAFPRTIIQTIEVEDRDGEIWTSTRARTAALDLTTTANPPTRDAAGTDVLVYVDLLPDRSDAAFTELQRSRAWKESTHIRMRHPGDIRPEDGGAISVEVATVIREASGRNHNATVHLVSRLPAALAALLGAQLNTIRVVAYDWTSGDGSGATYEPSMALESGVAGAPVVEVLR
jgi:hypothetical protein